MQEGYLAQICIVQLKSNQIAIADLHPNVYHISAQLSTRSRLPAWLHWWPQFYVAFRYLLCWPRRRVTKRSRVIRVPYGCHAVIAGLLALLSSILTLPILCFNFVSDKNYNALGLDLNIATRSSESDLPPVRDAICAAICQDVRESLDGSLPGLEDSWSKRTNYPQSARTNHQRRFFRAWKALLSRSTTQLEDIHAILANLSGFSSKEVL